MCVCLCIYVQKASAAGLQAIFSLNWESSRKKDALVKSPCKHANDRPPGKCTNGIYMTSNVL